MKLIATLLSLTIAISANSQIVDMSVFESMNMRQIGPAGMSGRITCIDVVESQPNTIYIGAASGGVWKSTSGGTEWEPIGDTMATLNIGAIAIQQSNPAVIWVGTGEGNPRNSQSSGFGLYKSIDAGRTWQLMGLEQTRNIHRVIIHPNDPNTVWVGAQGPAWGDNPNRGVYKTTDGGKTWRLVLEGNASTGIGDLVIDPTNPNKLIANLWDFRRDPWFFRSGGKGSGLYISHDGGENWTKRTDEDGLPEGDLGRIGLAIAPSNPNRIYALIEAKKNDLYRSDDGGFKWTKISSDKNAGNRPFYYSDIFVDPVNENRIYSLWSRVSRSEDGGKTWKIIIPYRIVHPDFQAFWIDPKDPNYIIIGNDGGLAISRDRAESWRYVKNLPLAQYYHINIDNELPYNVYGGMQDNGSWRGPAYVWSYAGLRNANYINLSGGDGFDVVPDPVNSERFGYSMSQQGYVGRYDLLTGYRKGIRPTLADTTKLRFNWNAPIAQDPFDAKTIYFGTQFVHKSTNNGDSWELISPDLTTNDTSFQKQQQSGGLTFDVTGAENFTTLVTIAPSPVNKDVLWVGSDDGRLHLTKDGGKSWTSLEDKLPGMPKGAWIPQIQPSKHSVDEAFVVVNDYRRNNWEPFLYHTTNGGNSWKRIASKEDFPGYCLSVIQDPVQANLVFVGTENGLYVSFDKGANWNHWNHGYPNVSTIDMKIQERESDLVIGTFGRAAYVLDNIAPLRNLAKNGISHWNEESLVMFNIPEAYHVEFKKAIGVQFGGDDAWKGDNRTTAARVQLYYHTEKSDTVKNQKTKGKLRVYNSKGDTIRTIKVELKDGFNRFQWSLNRKGVRSPSKEKPKPDADEPGGTPVLPGIYTVEIQVGDYKASKEVEVKMDPKLNVSLEDLTIRQKRFDEVEMMLLQITNLADQLRTNQAAIKKVNRLLPMDKDSTDKILLKAGKQLNDTIQGMLDEINGKQNVKGIFRTNDIIQAKVQGAYWLTWGTLSGNEQAYQNKLAKAVKAIELFKMQTQQFLKNEWVAYKLKVSELKLTPFVE
jgi:photosystem II stability/assembly factor-like uncharacterized protein